MPLTKEQRWDRARNGICTQCGSKTKLWWRCRSCRAKIRRQNEANRNPVIRRQQNKSYRDRDKQIVFKHYGNRCACCGEDRQQFLTIGHRNNDGARDSRCRVQKRSKNFGRRFSGHAWHARIIKLGFPDDLELQCWNCNMARATYGYCCRRPQ